MVLTELKGGLFRCIIFAEVDELMMAVSHVDLEYEQDVLFRLLVIYGSHLLIIFKVKLVLVFMEASCLATFEVRSTAIVRD